MHETITKEQVECKRKSSSIFWAICPSVFQSVCQVLAKFYAASIPSQLSLNKTILLHIAYGSAHNNLFLFSLPSNRVISSLDGKFGTVGDTFALVLEPLFMKILNLCKNHLLNP